MLRGSTRLICTVLWHLFTFLRSPIGYSVTVPNTREKGIIESGGYVPPVVCVLSLRPYNVGCLINGGNGSLGNLVLGTGSSKVLLRCLLAPILGTRDSPPKHL